MCHGPPEEKARGSLWELPRVQNIVSFVAGLSFFVLLSNVRLNAIIIPHTEGARELSPGENDIPRSPFTAKDPLAMETQEPFQVEPDEGYYWRLWDILQESVSLLNFHKVEYALNAGSLLGFDQSLDRTPWFDVNVDLAVSTTWLQRPGNLGLVLRAFKKNHFVLKRNCTGVDRKVTSIGGAVILEKGGVEVELKTTDMEPSIMLNWYRHGTLLIACPIPYSEIETVYWGDTFLKVRVPQPYEEVLRLTHGGSFDLRGRQSNKAPQTADVTAGGKCMVVEDRSRKDHGSRQGIVSCVTNRESLIQALILSKKLNEFKPRVPLEFYHMGTLDAHLLAHLEVYSFVSVVNLKTHARGPFVVGGSDFATCNIAALQTTELRNVLLVDPSIQFLQNPHYLLSTNDYVNARASCHALPIGIPCVVSSAPMLLEQSIQKAQPNLFRLAPTHPNLSTTSLFLHFTTMEVASVYQVSNGIGLWIYPTSDYFKWATMAVFLSPNAIVWKQKTAVPHHYLEALRTYWEFYLEQNHTLHAH